MSAPIVIARGNTKSISVGLEINKVAVTDLTNWSCHIQLRDSRTREIAGNVDREVIEKTQSQDKFLITLTSEETNIETSEYILGIEFRNSSTSQVIEDHKNIIKINIVEDWVY